MRSVVAPGRVVGLDAARAVALVGMMATHILADLDTSGSVALSHQLLAGRASALFAVLAGVGIALVSGRASPHRGRARIATSAGLAVRAALIAAVGLALGEVDSGVAVILAYYGVLFLLALPFLGLRTPALAVLGVGWLVVVPVLSHLVRPALPGPSYANPTFANLAEPWTLLGELLLTGYYPALPWLAYLLVGMAVGRTDLTRVRMALGLVVGGGVLAATAWAVSASLLASPGVRRTLAETFTGTGSFGLATETGLYGTTPTGSWWWLAVRTPHTATPFDLAHTVGTSLAVIGLALIAGRLLPRLLAVLLGAGAMTLSLYTAHVALRTPGWWDGDTAETFLGQVLAVLVVGAAFRLTRTRGPLEAAVGRTQDAVRRAVAWTPRR